MKRTDQKGFWITPVQIINIGRDIKQHVEAPSMYSDKTKYNEAIADVKNRSGLGRFKFI
jgi:hypothetical protein